MKSKIGVSWYKKTVIEKSTECHNHKPQPFPDTKRMRKPTNPNKHKSNKRTKSTKISSLFMSSLKSAFKHAQHAHLDHSVHAQIIVRLFALHSYILLYRMIVLADSDGPDQTALAICICPKTLLSHGAAHIICSKGRAIIRQCMVLMFVFTLFCF